MVGSAPGKDGADEEHKAAFRVDDQVRCVVMASGRFHVPWSTLPKPPCANLCFVAPRYNAAENTVWYKGDSKRPRVIVTEYKEAGSGHKNSE